jgi:O-antigen ligase
VWLAVVGHRLGFSLGEALDFQDGSVRLFGILGDNASHLLAFFVLYEGLRRRWLRFSFVLGPLLFGLPRGALVVLLAGVAWLLAGAVVRAVGRASLGALARALGAALIALGAAAALLLLTPLGPALAQRFDTTRRDIGLLGDRQASFQRAWQTFREHPIAGVGLGGYLQQVEDSGLAHDPQGTRQRDEPIDARRRTPEMGSAQNQLLQIAAESGSIGLLAYALFCTAALRTVLAATRRRRGPLLAAACAYVVAVLLGLQTAVWLLDKSTVGALVFTLLGIAERGERLSANATLPSALAASPAP